MMEDRDAIALAERVLAILDEGRFSTTYKFALFTAFLDLCMEKTSTKGVVPSVLTTYELASKVVESYWDHSLPYGQHGVLRQGGNKGGQAEILRRICEAREVRAGARSDTIFRARLQDPIGFESLVRFVEWKLIEMPIPRLQVLGRIEDRFLYQYNWTQSVSRAEVVSYQRGGESDFDNRLLLRPGVAENLVRLAGLLRPLFRRHWAMMVASSNDLHEAELEEFLFGAERIPLDAVRAPLLDLQDGFCFYCDRRIVGRADVDHFIPWARFRDDGLDNLVAAHPRCNNDKRDALAAAAHVERWTSRMRNRGADLEEASRQVQWFRNPNRSASVASALYLRLPSGAALWLQSREFVPIERPRIADALSGL